MITSSPPAELSHHRRLWRPDLFSCSCCPLTRPFACAPCARCSDNLPRLTEFTGRFKGRFVELMNDIDSTVAAAGLKLLSVLVKAKQVCRGPLNWKQWHVDPWNQSLTSLDPQNSPLTLLQGGAPVLRHRHSLPLSPLPLSPQLPLSDVRGAYQLLADDNEAVRRGAAALVTQLLAEQGAEAQAQAEKEAAAKVGGMLWGPDS